VTRPYEESDIVLELYRDAGFEMSEDFRDLPDHISVELECLYVLLFREAQLCRQEAGLEARATVNLRARLIGEHLGRWVGPFAEAMSVSAQTNFYRELAEFTRRFIALEQQLLTDLVSSARMPGR
jgi:TorA maturation chaperone TorD